MIVDLRSEAHTVLTRFRSDCRGATAIEYVMIAFLVSLGVIAGASTIGTTLKTRYFGAVADGLR